jgi:hypothetical protein
VVVTAIPAPFADLCLTRLSPPAWRIACREGSQPALVDDVVGWRYLIQHRWSGLSRLDLGCRGPRRLAFLHGCLSFVRTLRAAPCHFSLLRWSRWRQGLDQVDPALQLSCGGWQILAALTRGGE